jgi:PAS domain S-box-containing protein
MKTDRKVKAQRRSQEMKANGKSGRAVVKLASNPKTERPPLSYEHIPIGIVETSLNGKYLNVNEEFCRITGYEREELLRFSLKDLTHEEDLAYDLQLHDRLVAGQIPYYKIEKRLRCKDGGFVWVELTRSLVRGPRGAARYVVGATLDLSDRKQVERVLHESVERLRLATGAAQMFMWEWDFQRQVYTIADNFEQVLGFSGGLLPQNSVDTVFKLSPEEDVEAIMEAVQHAVQNHSDVHAIQYRVINPENGQIVWLQVSGKITYDDLGNPLRIFGVAQNITDSKRAEAALALAHRQAERFVDRTGRLQKITAALSASITPIQVAEVIVNEGAPALGAATSTVVALHEEAQTLELLYSTAPETVTRLYKRFSLSLNVPVSHAVHSRQPVWIESQQQYVERYPHLADQIRQWGHQAALAIPMISKERILGVMIMSFDQAMTFSPEDKDYALTIARQGAQALERAWAEDALRESEERFRALVSQATAGITQTDLNNRLVFVNPQFGEMLGFSRSELMGKTIWELTHPDDIEESRRLFERLISEGKPYQFEKRFIRRDGQVLWANVSVSPIRDVTGKPKGGVGVIVDITERKRVETNLRESEERYRFIVENTSDGIWRIELDAPMPVTLSEEEQIEWYYQHAVIHQCNLGLARMYGYESAEAVAGLPLRMVMSPENPVNLELTRRFIRSSYRLVDAESREIGEDGRELVFINNMIGIVEDGKLKGEWGTNRDITERKRSEEALAEFARQQQALYRLSEQMQRTDTQEDVCEVALDAIIDALQCDRASILLFDETHRMRFVAWRGLSDEYRRATDGHSPWTGDTKDPRPICIDDIRTADLDASLRATIEREGIGSLAFIPLVSNGRLIGKFMAYFDTHHHFIEDEVALGLTIANNLAFGIERKRAEQALRQSEERYRAVVESQAEMLCRFRPDGKILFANAAYAQARGTTPEALLHGNFWDFIPQEDHQAVRALLDSLSPDAPEVQIENRFETVNGERWTLWTNRALKFDANGKVLEAQSSGIDITERKQAEKRLALLADLSESLRSFQDPYELMFVVSRALGEHLQVKRVFFSEVDPEEDHEIVHRDYHAGLPSVAGAHKFSDHSLTTRTELSAGKTVIDSDSHGYPEKTGVAVPLMRDNRWVATLWVRDDRPRQWTREEVALLETVADRTWTVIEKLRINAALQESEQRFREIFETAGVSVWLEDFTQVKREIEELRRQGVDDLRSYCLENPDFVQRAINLVHVLDVNSETVDLFGARNKEELLGSLSKVFASETTGLFIDELVALSEGTETLRSESLVRALDGRSIPVLFTIHIGPEIDGHNHVVVTLTDIAERKRTEELFSTLVESAPFGVYFIDSEFRLRAVNKGSRMVFSGIDPLIGRDFEEILRIVWTEPFASKAIERFRHTLRTGEPYISPTITARRANVDETQSYDWQIHRIIMPDGSYGVVCYFYDLSEQKRMEDAVRASESLYRAIARNIPGGGVYVVDQDFKYLVAEGPVTEALGLSREMLEQRKVMDVFPDERGARMVERLRRTFAGETVSFETTYNGRIYWTQQAPLHNSMGQAIILTLDITERKKAEEALRESEERFRAILRQATAGIVRKDAQGRLIFVNDAYCTMLGYPESALIGKTVWDLMHPDDAAESKRLYERLITEGVSFNVERRFMRQDGSVIWVDASVSPIMDPDGRIQSAVAVEVDITGRYMAEQALRSSEERYRNLFNLVPIAVYSCDADGLIEAYNQRAVELWGREPAIYDPNEKYCGSYRIYSSDGTFVPHDRCPIARSLNGELLAPEELEIVIEREDGVRRNVIAHPLLLRNEQGKITGAINCLYDITERKQAEEALQQLNLQLENRVQQRTARLNDAIQTLRDEVAERRRVEEALRKSEAAARENEEKLSTLFDLLPVGISFLDQQGRIIQANSALEHILKLSKEQLSAQAHTTRQYIRPNGTPMPPDEFASRRALAEGRTIYNVETGIVREDAGVIWTSVSAAPVAVADVGAVEVTVDITESKLAERALQESRERLQTLSQRLVEVQEEERRAIARELHDRVGQTLAALNINLIIINDQLAGKVDEQINARLSDSMKLVTETITLVRDVMSNLRPSVLDDYGLEAALQSYLDDYMRRYDIRVVMDRSGSLISRPGPSVEMTFLRIAQEALMNVARHAGASEVSLSLHQNEGAIQMTVQDNGRGIQLMEQARRLGSHGLTIMRERAEALGGTLEVESAPGQGTRITVTIPVETRRAQDNQEQFP